MPLPYQEVQQDSMQVSFTPLRDSLKLKSDSAYFSGIIRSQDSVPHRIRTSLAKPLPEITDTISVCRRNSIEDVTFYDSSNLVNRIEPLHLDAFPFLFTAKGREIQEAAKTSLVKHLRPGDDIPFRSLHDDWVILIILFASFMFALIRKSSDNLFHGIERFNFFRGVNNHSSRDLGGIFTLESTITNLLSFIILGLFVFSIASYHNLIPSSISGIIFWIISVIIIIIAVTLRHLVCMVTGAVSGEREVFTEYLLGIYQFYHFSAVFIFVVTIFPSYTTIIPLKLCLFAGVLVIIILYLIRVIRLFIIFINKNISLFYLILYLCALEILPAIISVKYISGLS